MLFVGFKSDEGVYMARQVASPASSTKEWKKGGAGFTSAPHKLTMAPKTRVEELVHMAQWASRVFQEEVVVFAADAAAVPGSRPWQTVYEGRPKA